MGKINVLDKFTAEKIAAGEVVERPASVIKELLENAIDAGATTVVVEIKRGGTTYMRVTDNGSGMDKDDARTAFLRHATSKIKTDKDLEHISTLGFRGEALCSIAAVSRTELFTKQRTSPEGTHVIVEGGEEILCEGAGCPDGTTIVVKNLFFNTPARMKFMKKDSVEAGAITDVCNKQALSHPNVSIRLIRDGKEVLFSPGDNVLKNTVHSIFGKDIAAHTINVSYTKDGVSVAGLTGKGNLSRPNRLMQIFFVNGRYVVNKTLLTAVSEAYKNELMIGRFPVCVLDISLDPSLVDVNVHPGKTEIKFASDQSVYEAVYWAVKNALAETSAPRSVPLPASREAYKMPSAPEPPVQISFTQKNKNTSLNFKPFTPRPEPSPARIAKSINEIREEVKPYEGKLPVRNIEGIENKKEEIPKVKNEPLFSAPPEKTVKKEAIENPPSIGSDFRIIGQLFSTYILAEGDGEFLLMDQHAAHERIRFEEIKKGGYKTDTQLLLMPISVNLTPSEKELALEKSDFLLDMGFEFEDFGKNAIVLRSLPADCLYEEGSDLFIEMLGVLGGNEGGEISAIRDKAVYTVACRSAIKANLLLSISELQKLFSQAMALEGISTCPHGRPICIKLTKYQIEKMFGRIV
ncbi:MAG: DNA mismatch repair endonuclease MutL [Clostridia bacterium]|nr:DNA mismatch repair endonuclease MutL [Clostridia bacterium]